MGVRVIANFLLFTQSPDDPIIRYGRPTYGWDC
jgi:hypothetical protein